MGPRKSYNYGTFIAPPGCCAETTHLEGGTAKFSEGSAPVSTITGSDYYRVLSSGLQLAKNGAEVVISQMNDDIAQVSRVCYGSRWSEFLMRVFGQVLLFCQIVEGNAPTYAWEPIV